MWNDSFEAWKRRPIYVVQAYTHNTVRPDGDAPIRLLPKHRDAACSENRAYVAAVIRSRRANGLNFRAVRAACEPYCGKIPVRRPYECGAGLR